MSMRPGSKVTSPRSISVAEAEPLVPSTDTMRLPSTTTAAGERTRPASTSTQRSARTTIWSVTGSAR